jgi:hypothetical protein
MTKDYLDRVCEYPTTKTRIARNVSVDELWQMRIRLVISHKKAYLVEFYESFYDFISQVHEGTMTDKWHHPYAEYLRGYHKQWSEGLPRAFQRKLNSAIELYHSIKEEGMRDPLGMIVEDGRTFLYRGYRRLVILKVLGVKRAKVKYAIVRSHSSAQQSRDSEKAVAPL